MPTYANEYEGFGNALMNIGSMYYSQEEKKKEEERLRKEKEDERKYLADQAEVEWKRRAPIEEMKAALLAAKQASTEAERNRPRYFNSGSERITQMRVPDGKGGYEFVEGSEPIKEQPRAQRERSPFVRVGNDLVDTTTMQSVYKGESTAKAAKPLFTEKDLLAAKTKLNEMQIDLGQILVPAEKAAAQSAIDNQMGIVDTIKQRIETPLMKPAADASTPAPNPDAPAKVTAGGTPAEKAAFAKWTAAYEEAIALGATKEEAEILANEAAGE